MCSSATNDYEKVIGSANSKQMDRPQRVLVDKMSNLINRKVVTLQHDNVCSHTATKTVVKSNNFH